MRVTQWRWASDQPLQSPSPDPSADLVFVFGGPNRMADPRLFDQIRALYPDALIAGASTSGEVLGSTIHDDSLAITSLAFDQAAAALAQVELRDDETDYAAGKRLVEGLPHTHPAAGPLRHVFVLADGVRLNGSAFARGMEAELPEGVAVTGGLAADGAQFERTPIWANAALDRPSAVVVGLYGEGLRIGYGAVGGWDPFGPERLVTKSEGNVLHELDGRSALALYKEYLGPHAEALPASGLLFPLAIRTETSAYDLVRTTLGVDEANQTITFAGDIPEGAYARFMKTNVDRIIDGAHSAATAALQRAGDTRAELALVVSCVGRRLTLGQRIEEELDEIDDLIGGVPITGFYSHGEMAPAECGVQCELHNQTMTLTTLAEA
ncbi:MAG: FIST N-terminal domain-containing protein [Bacteroidota bacterium]